MRELGAGHPRRRERQPGGGLTLRLSVLARLRLTVRVLRRLVPAGRRALGRLRRSHRAGYRGREGGALVRGRVGSGEAREPLDRRRVGRPDVERDRLCQCLGGLVVELETGLLRIRDAVVVLVDEQVDRDDGLGAAHSPGISLRLGMCGPGRLVQLVGVVGTLIYRGLDGLRLRELVGVDRQ